MLRLGASLFAAVVLLGSVGCVATDDSYDEAESVAAADGKADATSELRVRAGDTTVWMTTALARVEDSRGPAFVLRGRASREVTDGNAYIFDDVYGEFGLRGPRSFEVRWDIRSNTAPLIQGVQQYQSLNFVHSATRPDHLTSRVIVRPRLDSFSGATSIYLTAELTPVVVDGRVVYRLAGKSSRAFAAVVAIRGDIAMNARPVDATHFVVDLTQADVDALAGATGAQLEVVLDGTTRKRAHLGLAIKALAITTGDAYETWPPPTCTAETQACLAALPAGTTDLSSCGEAVLVRACRR